MFDECGTLLIVQSELPFHLSGWGQEGKDIFYGQEDLGRSEPDLHVTNQFVFILLCLFFKKSCGALDYVYLNK